MTEREPDPNSTRKKKVYKSPQLVSYGDITELTTAVGWMGAVDGGMFFMSRTG
jgi:hypothetical protein